MCKEDSIFNIIENSDMHFHIINELIEEINEKNRWISVDEYKINEYNRFMETLSHSYLSRSNKKSKNGKRNKQQLSLSLKKEEIIKPVHQQKKEIICEKRRDHQASASAKKTDYL